MKRTITATALILLGVILLLANINAYNMQALFATWWPIALIVAAALMLMNERRNYGWPLFFAGVGVVLLLNNLNITAIDLGDIFLPALVIMFGVSMLLNGSHRQAESENNDEEVTAILSGASNKNVSKNYTGAKITAVMGGVEMDLSHAQIKNHARLDVFVLMGGLELRVPEDVIVKNRSAVILGGFEDKTRPTEAKSAPVLYIDGSIVMGGVEIKR
jgi:predicted membrane protein